MEIKHSKMQFPDDVLELLEDVPDGQSQIFTWEQ